MQERQEQWWYVRSVTTDGRGGVVTAEDVMEESVLLRSIEDTEFMYGPACTGGVGSARRWTWSVEKWRGIRSTDMLIALPIQ